MPSELLQTENPPSGRREPVSRLDRLIGTVSNWVPRSMQGIFGNRGPEKKKRAETTGDRIEAWAKERGIGEEMTVAPGVLIEQGVKTPYAYVIPEGDIAEVYYCINDVCCTIATLPAGSIVGEISALAGGVPTANVRLLKQTTLYAIPHERLCEVQKEPHMTEELKTMMHERLLRTADFQEKMEEYLEVDHAETLGLLENIEVYSALNVGGIVSGLREGESTQRNFTLMGIHRETRKIKKQAFAVAYKKHRTKVSITITGDKSEIPIDIDLPDLKYASTGYIKMRADEGYGFYGRILRYLLKNVEHIHADIREESTSNFIEKYPHGSIPPHALLAAHSPVVAARKEFISRMEGKSLILDSYRVDDLLSLILSIATEVERSIEEGSDENLRKFYGMGRAEVFKELQEIAHEYEANEVFGSLRTEVQELFRIQRESIDELAAQYSVV